MQFRLRAYDEENHNYKLITYFNVEDYDTMFKTLTFMAEHRPEYSIEINTENLVETLGDNYEVIGVALCCGKEHGEDELTPHFVVDLEEC